MKKYLGILIAIIGLLIIMYPGFVKILNQTLQTKAILDYKAIELAEEELERQKQEKQEQEEYNKELLQTNEFLSQAKFDTITQGVSSFNALDLGDIISVINIPKINVTLPIYEGTSAEVLQFGVGHLETTSYPIGGIGTHCVLTGHTGLSTNKLFDDIINLEIGDKFSLETGDEKLYYEVDKIDVVLPEETNKIILDPNQDYVTLVTCTPIYVNTHRLLVRGKRITQIEDIDVDEYDISAKAQKSYEANKKDLIQLIIAFILFTVLISYSVIYTDKYLRTKRYIAVDDEEVEKMQKYANRQEDKVPKALNVKSKKNYKNKNFDDDEYYDDDDF